MKTKPRITYDSVNNFYMCVLEGPKGWFFSGYGDTPCEAYESFVSQYGVNLGLF